MKLQTCLIAGTLAASLITTGASLAVAQSTTNKKSSQKETPAAKQKNAWAVNCGGGADDADLVCRMVQNVIIAETKQRLLSVVIQPSKGAKNHMLVIGMPHGLNIPEGVELQVDELKPTQLKIKTSDQSGTYTNEPINAVMLASMRKGDKLKVSYTFANGKKITIPLGLRGFTAAYKKLSQK